MLEILKELYEEDEDRVVGALEAWAKLASSDGFGTRGWSSSR